MRYLITSAGLLLAPLGAGAAAPEAETDPPPFHRWGAETLRVIHHDLWLPEHGLYAEELDLETGRRSGPAFLWGAGVQLSALVAAAAVEPERYLAPACEYADALQVHWLEHDGIWGFDVLPGPKKSDRYYDDNAWLVLALAELFEVSGERRFLERAEATFRFVLSGGDDMLGGGLYWRESPRESKNTCTNAPAIVGALRLHQLTGEDHYLRTAEKLYGWTRIHLQDDDGLFWDNIKLNGRIDRRKFSYNTGLMIRANALFHDITGEDRYLEEARRCAEAAERHWVTPEGAVTDSGRFAHLLLESFLALDERVEDNRWTSTVSRCLVHLHAEIRRDDGRYPSHWSRPRRRPLRDVDLLDQASPARIYWLAAAEAAADRPAPGEPPPASP